MCLCHAALPERGCRPRAGVRSHRSSGSRRRNMAPRLAHAGRGQPHTAFTESGRTHRFRQIELRLPSARRGTPSGTAPPRLTANCSPVSADHARHLGHSPQRQGLAEVHPAHLPCLWHVARNHPQIWPHDLPSMLPREGQGHGVHQVLLTLEGATSIPAGNAAARNLASGPQETFPNVFRHRCIPWHGVG